LFEAGLTDVEDYGIRDDLPHPRYIVPLTSPDVLAWYLDHAYFPRSAPGALVSPWLARTAHLGTGRWVFPAIGFTARAGDAPC